MNICRHDLHIPLLLLILMPISRPGFAQNNAGQKIGNASRSVLAYELEQESSIDVDGQLEEAVWERVSFTGNLIQREPNEGAEASAKTEVGFIYGEEALYIGARMYKEDPSRLQSPMTKRDDLGNAERLIISLDTYLDRRTSRSFAVSVSGIRAEFYLPKDSYGHRNRDYTFDPVWTAETHIDSNGWTAEMRIPFSQLRFTDKEEQIWGLNINRYQPRKNEDDYWVMVPQDETGWASRFGLLRGLNNVEPKPRIELLPYAAGEALLTNPDSQNPYVKRMNLSGRIGGNLKVGLGPNMTLNATINPDFGQVEADPAQVNLSAFETFFEEKRPFFTEGQQLFDALEGGGRRSDSYFYSRRIGASPSYHPDANFVDLSSNTSIIGAGKITGRLPGGLSLGGLSAVTAKENATFYDVATDQEHNVLAEPLTSYNVIRMQQEFGRYTSTAGFILTGVHRNLKKDSFLAGELSRTAVTGGTDWNLRFNEGKYELSGDLGFSYLNGEPSALLNVQESSARYYQRPDASYLSVDSTRHSLSGYRARLNFEKNAGRHWLWEVGGSTKSPGFELNDTGILFEADDISYRTELTFRENKPGSWYQSYRLSLDTRASWNYGGTRIDNQLGLDGRVEWKNFWETSLEFEYSPRAMDDVRTRGGPLMGTGRRFELQTNFRTNRSSTFYFDLFQNSAWDELGGWEFFVSPEFQYQPGGRWNLSVDPRFKLQTEKRQYLTTLDDGPSDTYGKRYIFSSIDRSSLSLRIRFNYSFNPDLSVEAYAEPFVASGNYYKPGELAKPGSYRLDNYNVEATTKEGNLLVNDGNKIFEVPDPDFLVKSFRSNIVLRYQWKPGSTFFLVWQQNRFTRDHNNRFIEPGDLVNALGETGDNIFAIKFTYWFPVK